MPVSLGEWLETELAATRHRLFGPIRPAEVEAALHDASNSLAAYEKQRGGDPSPGGATGGREPRRRSAAE